MVRLDSPALGKRNRGVSVRVPLLLQTQFEPRRIPPEPTAITPSKDTLQLGFHVRFAVTSRQQSPSQLNMAPHLTINNNCNQNTIWHWCTSGLMIGSHSLRCKNQNTSHIHLSRVPCPVLSAVPLIQPLHLGPMSRHACAWRANVQRNRGECPRNTGIAAAHEHGSGPQLM